MSQLDLAFDIIGDLNGEIYSGIGNILWRAYLSLIRVATMSWPRR
jgi:hypothetical protein